MIAYSIAQTALNVSQQVLDLIGENLANLNTPGYSRQTANLTEVVAGGIGEGVAVGSVTRSRSPLIDAAVTRNTYESASTAAAVQPLQQTEALFTPGTNSLDTQIGQFFNDVTQLTSQPDDATLRAQVVGDLSDIASSLNNLASNLDQLRVGVGNQAASDVGQVNQLAQQIASLNAQIKNARLQGQPANELQDQRDQLINQLAHYVDVRTVAQPYGETNVVGAGVPLVVGEQALGLNYGTDPSGNIVLTPTNLPVPVTVAGGELQGLIQTYNQTIPGFRSQLDTLAGALAQQVDAVQATGIASSGPLTTATGSRGVVSATANLATAGNTQFPVQAGTLEISVTNLATGQVTLDPVAIDPTNQSLQDVAAAITSATGGAVQATVNAGDNTLQLQAQAGFAFDFAGRPPTNATPSGTFAGTTTASLAGAYTGAANDTYRFQVQNAGGTVGVTPNLTVQVLDQANDVVATLDVGSGYTPGSALAVADGLTVSFSAGTFTAGNLSFPVTARPDTSGLLTALGVDTAFTGHTALDLAVNPALLADPAALAASRTGQPGDGSNLQRLAATRDAATLAGGSQTIEQFYAALVGDVGTQTKQAQDVQTAQQALGKQLAAQQQSISGVDENEELLNMLQFQRAFQLASSYVSAVNQALDSLFNVTL